MKDVKFVNVPKYEELGVEKMWSQMKDDKEFSAYFPTPLPKGRTFPREYFWNIANTVHELYVQRLISHANKQRFSGGAEETKDDCVQVTEEWADLLLANPFVSCKSTFTLTCGRI